MKPMISVKNLSKKFKDQVVLDNINLEINEGEIMYVIGKSGSGKSVLLKNMVKLLTPDEGEIIIDDNNIFSLNDIELNEFRKKTGVLFQMAALFDSLSVFENVAFSLRRFTKHSNSQIADIVHEKLSLVGLKGYADRRPASLSIGMQKRVGLARAIALNPEIIFCDEPTTGVDPLLGAAVDDLIVKLNKELSVTVMVISHDMSSVFRVAHRVAMLYNGKFEFTGSAEELQKSDNPVVKQFVAGSASGPMSII
ncbi:MAG: ABC transporter ATP-binding protein [Spirochaetia bacterium]|nr:ABC transporter ATP-binding protein [Spirochaetia bacterium]